MNLARHQISDTAPTQIIDARFDGECRIFTCTTPEGFAVYRARPLKLLRKHEFKDGTLAMALPLHTSSILFLLGGGRSPRYPPNKVVLWDESKAREVAELEFRERVRGMSCRRGWLAISLRRRLVVYQFGEEGIKKYGEWDTHDNIRGLVSMAFAPSSTVVAIPGSKMGHVQILHLPPCPAEPLSVTTSPTHKPSFLALVSQKPRKLNASIIVAHTSALSTLTVSPSGSFLATTSSRGTLVRVWDTVTGQMVKELRRGSDQAEIYGVAFRPDEQELCVWSDKGTVHVFVIGYESGVTNRTSAFSPLSPYLKLPKYFASEWSYCHYRLPPPNIHFLPMSQRPALDPDAGEEEKCVVGWIEVPVDGIQSSVKEPRKPLYHLLALTYSGGWYRLSLPSATSSLETRASSQSTHSRSQSSSSNAPSEKDISRVCTLEEFRRFGRWDGWG